MNVSGGAVEMGHCKDDMGDACVFGIEWQQRKCLAIVVVGVFGLNILN